MNFREFFMAATAYEPFWRQWESPQRPETQLHIDEVARGNRTSPQSANAMLLGETSSK